MWIYFPNLAILKDWLLPMQLKPKKRATTTNTPLINEANEHDLSLGMKDDSIKFYYSIFGVLPFSN
jgi:hypothetical protein